MAEFVYDEMVTAQSLNEIAVDLGAGDFSVFEDSTPYAVGKLNEITQALVGSGISTALNKFEITVSEDSIVVGTGIAFFASGKKLKLTVPVTLPFQAGELYLYEKLSTGTVSINIGELPTDNYIHLATINEYATFIDRRMIAKAKVELPTEGCSYVFTDMITYANAEEYDGKTITLPIAGATKIFINSSSPYVELVYNIKTQKFTGVRYHGGDYEVTFNEENTYLYYRSGYYPEIITIGLVSQTETEVTFKYTTKNVASERNMKLNYYIFGGIEND